ncbi:MAG: LPXTG cell wall anchor domain-containing protein [Candidatus Paceibacterota bacterium]
MKWIIENKEWLFSGAGVAIIAFLISFFRKKKRNQSTIQKIKSGANSTNTQINMNEEK